MSYGSSISPLLIGCLSVIYREKEHCPVATYLLGGASDDKVRKEETASRLCNLEAIYLEKLWSHLGLNQGLPDYESGALTN